MFNRAEPTALATATRPAPEWAPASLSLIDQLRHALSSQEHATALLAANGTASTAAELLVDLEHAGASLAAMGVRRGDRIAYALSDSPATAVLAMAVMSVASAAPLNPRLTDVECERQIRALRVGAVILQSNTDTSLRRVAARLRLRLIELAPFSANDRPSRVEFASTPFAHADPSILTHEVDWSRVDDAALIVQTSGTTGASKVVPLTHRNVFSMMRANCDVLALSPSDRCLSVMPLYHIHGLGAVLCSLLSGGSVVVTEGFAADSFFEALRRFEPTWYTAVPTVHQTVLAHADAHRELVADLAARRVLRFVRSGSAPMPAGVPAKLMQRFATRYIEACGATECSAYICSNRFGDERIGSVGRPMPGTDARIVDPAGRDVDVDVEGELIVRGPGVFAGYERSTIDAPASNGIVDGYFHTGDLARRDADGFYYLTGRIKEQINRAGMKISPREVDAALALHPLVAHACCFALPDPLVGDEVAAVIVRKADGGTLSALELQRFAAERLADYKVPRRLIFVDAIPTNAVGKISRVALPRQLGLLTDAATRTVAHHVEQTPHSPTELLVAATWSRVLGQPIDDIDQTFAAVGGDSLQAVNLSLELERAFARRIPVAAVPADATVRSLAQALEADGWHPAPAAPVVLRSGLAGGDRPTLFCLPGVGGNVHCFAGLSLGLADLGMPIVGLPLPGTDGLEPPLPSIDVIAERFLQTIRVRQPHGPYLLAGYSFGGRIAFELCRRLRAADETVRALVLIDTPAPAWPPPLRGLARVRMQLARCLRDGLIPTLRRLATSRCGDNAQSAEAMLRATAIRDVPPARVALQAAMIEAADRANDRWQPSPIDAPIVIVRAERPAWEHCDTSDPTMGWSPLAKTPIRVLTVAGVTHATLFHPPHAAALTAAVRTAIAVARETDPAV